MELKKEEVLLLGAMLHDTGKFAQRALDESERELHQELSERVVNALLAFLEEKDRKAVGEIVREHHEREPSDPLVRIIKNADDISASERYERKFLAKDKLPEFRLRSSLSMLGEKIEDGNDITRLPMFCLAPLGTYADNIFPIKSSGDKGHYGELWKKFADEVKLLPTGSFDAFFLSLYHLLYKYTWCVPSAAFYHHPTISLFDHSRTTTAIAWCLYHATTKDEPFLLIQGDLGGIQGFIYCLASPDKAQAGMARRLRGRSLYLSLLTESIARFIMKGLGLPEPNLIWVGGGGFLLLAPNTEDLRKELDKAIREIECKLLDKHHGQLSVSIATLSASVKEFREKYGELTENLRKELAKAKERRFALQNKWPELKSDEKECIVCAAPMNKDERKLVKFADGTEELVFICPDCQLYEEIGGILPDSNYLLWTEEDWNPPKEETSDKDDEKRNAVFVEILGKKKQWCLVKDLNKLKDSLPSKGVLYSLKSMTSLEPAVESPTLARGFRFIAKHVPDAFEDMAKRAEGPDYLAALRMDVDDMGYLLAKGIPEDFRTPSIYASISRTLDLFFSGYMNTLIRDSNKDKLYIVYAGGDDLFIVGAWDAVLDLARDISEKFGEYTKNPENLHLSAGYFTFKPKFPLGRAAEGAGEAEHEAKNRKPESDKDQGKNALHAFGETFKWSDVQEALELAKTIGNYLEDERISRSFVQTMLDIYRRDYKENRLTWAARVYYQLARNVSGGKAAKTPEERVKAQKETIRCLETNLVRCEPGKEKMKTAQLWASVVLLKTRKTDKKPKEEKA